MGKLKANVRKHKSNVKDIMYYEGANALWGKRMVK